MRIRGLRSALGRRRTVCGERRVDVDHIPFLDEKHQVLGVDELSIIGDAPKDFIICASGVEYIAKKPRREGPIECVTEYLIGRIGAALPLKVAEGRLVRLRTRDGSADVRFLSRHFFNRREEQLVHGSQLVAACFDLQEKDLDAELLKEEWRFYTVDLVVGVLKDFWPEAWQPLVESFSRMMAFDALIGANDRHAQNWGVVQNVKRKDAPPRFAPVFDTARGLMWNTGESKLCEWQGSKSAEERVKAYAGRSVPLIGIEAPSRPSHFDVMAYVLRQPLLRKPAVDVILAFDPDANARMLHRDFRRVLSRTRLEFIDRLLRYRHARLIELLQRERSQ